MKRRYLALGISLLVIATIAGVVFAMQTDRPVEAASPVPRGVDEAIRDIEKSIDPARMTSSNPYEYTLGNAAYDELVAAGTPALPRIVSALDGSSASGLREYLLAIAGERIAWVDLKRDPETRWATGKEWPAAWRRHLEKVPDKVMAIVDSREQQRDKVRDLAALGTPAAPFISDALMSGHDELAPALETLLADGMVEVPSTAGPPKVTRDWVVKNKGRFDDLRKMVEAERH